MELSKDTTQKMEKYIIYEKYHYYFNITHYSIDW
ncbi:hypothetical protein HDE71_001143 [Janthinobacterium sp. S3M3]|nr:hypothetical protein [Janthinobacterium sp. S3T4]MBB5612146.1 hypothetical protein [Janthinobacterium sp. S3M3]